MHLLYLNNREIKLLSYKKDIFKQIQIDYFSKTHSTKLLENNRIYNVDILASAVKEALSNVFKNQKTQKDILFILPSPPFFTKRINLPLDVHPQAIQSFIAQKLLTLYPYKDLEFFYTLHELENKRIAIVFCLEKNILEDLSEICRILNLNFKGATPESLAYFKLFEKTLSKSKKENIWYMHAHENSKIQTASYFYDNFGPWEEPKLEFEAETIDQLKQKIIREKEKRKEIKFNRLILSGNLSLQIRQDLLTKEIGIWVNPFAKIIERFYETQTKKIVNQDPKIFLKYDSHFSLIANENIPSLSLKKTKYSFDRENKKGKLPNLKPFILPFILSLTFTFLIVWGAKNFRKTKIKFPTSIVKKTTPTPTTTSTPTPTPTPIIKKSEIKLKILNGSGIKGQAAKLSTYLKEKGYKDIVVGNADSFNYEHTIIKLSNEKYKETISKDLKELLENPKFEKEKEKPLQDITIIIGKDLQFE